MLRTAGITLGFFLAASIAAVVLVAGGQIPKIGDPTPDIKGGPWINSRPLTMAGLRGRVVMVEFWTYG